MRGGSESGEAERHFLSVPQWPAFAIAADAVSGRVPVTRIGSWREMPTMLEQPFFSRPRTQLIFRGHRRYDWPLTPSLGRFDPRKIITADVADAQLRFFRRAVRGRLDDRTLVDVAQEYELWSVGQHHGLMTPLLDWTESPYVALFFAFADEDRIGEQANPYRAVYVLNKTHVEGEDRCPDVHVLEPRKDDHGRLVNQAGLFTYSSYGNTLENFLVTSLEDEVLANASEGNEAKILSEYLCKIYIPNAERADCLRHLRMMNVHHASLMPDLIGAANYCNVLVADEARALHEAEERERQTPPSQGIAAAAEPAPTASSGDDLLAALKAVLLHESATHDDPQVNAVASELAEELEARKYMDWPKREDAQAAMRSAARVVLIRHNYPAEVRDAVIAAIPALLARPREAGLDE